MRRLLLAFVVLLMATIVPTASSTCDGYNALWLIIDVSGSIGSSNMMQQAKGYKAAVTDVIPTYPWGSIAIGVSVFSTEVITMFPIRTIGNQSALDDLTAVFQALQTHPSAGLTRMKAAITHAAESIHNSSCSGSPNRVIDMSTDGKPNPHDQEPTSAMKNATAAGIRVNCLAVNYGTCAWATANGGLAFTAPSFSDVHAVLTKKLKKELHHPPTPTMSTSQTRSMSLSVLTPTRTTTRDHTPSSSTSTAISVSSSWSNSLPSTPSVASLTSSFTAPTEGATASFSVLSATTSQSHSCSSVSSSRTSTLPRRTTPSFLVSLSTTLLASTLTRTPSLLEPHGGLPDTQTKTLSPTTSLSLSHSSAMTSTHSLPRFTFNSKSVQLSVSMSDEVTKSDERRSSSLTWSRSLTPRISHHRDQCKLEEMCSGHGTSVKFDESIERCVCDCQAHWLAPSCAECPFNFNATENCNECAYGFEIAPSCFESRHVVAQISLVLPLTEAVTSLLKTLESGNKRKLWDQTLLQATQNDFETYLRSSCTSSQRNVRLNTTIFNVVRNETQKHVPNGFVALIFSIDMNAFASASQTTSLRDVRELTSCVESSMSICPNMTNVATAVEHQTINMSCVTAELNVQTQSPCGSRGCGAAVEEPFPVSSHTPAPTTLSPSPPTTNSEGNRNIFIVVGSAVAAVVVVAATGVVVACLRGGKNIKRYLGFTEDPRPEDGGGRLLNVELEML